ncbi:MAG: hypothetical protein GTN74_11910 [Proteobacteria bacterium]|nr:hypothetical protein [Pseudomonadota bacterium]NIS71002.1 hypothetical protein [Pseudomonadota bacterium]
MKNRSKYTCRDYREEMILLSLKRRLAQKNLSDKERRFIIEEIEKLESDLAIDK